MTVRQYLDKNPKIEYFGIRFPLKGGPACFTRTYEMSTLYVLNRNERAVSKFENINIEDIFKGDGENTQVILGLSDRIVGTI